MSFGELPVGNPRSKAERQAFIDLIFSVPWTLCAALPWVVGLISEDAPTGEERVAPAFWRNGAFLSFTKTP